MKLDASPDGGIDLLVFRRGLIDPALSEPLDALVSTFGSFGVTLLSHASLQSI